jgi:hypothetical protein
MADMICHKVYELLMSILRVEKEQKIIYMNNESECFTGTLVASVGNRDQWKNNGSAGLNKHSKTMYENTSAKRECFHTLFSSVWISR